MSSGIVVTVVELRILMSEYLFAYDPRILENYLHEKYCDEKEVVVVYVCFTECLKKLRKML